MLSGKGWYVMGRAKIDDGLTASQRHYLRNREQVTMKTRLRQQMHPERGREYTRQHRLRKYGAPIVKTQLQRFMDKVEPVTESGCWIWNGTCQKNGYGRTAFGNHQSGFAHRWSYMHFVGAIPPGNEIDHLCRVRCCVNPNHLRTVTHAENMAARC